MGYVPREDAVYLAPFFDSGCSHVAHVKKILTSGRLPVPIVHGSLYRPEANIAGAVTESRVPRRTPPPEQDVKNAARPTGCLAIFLVIGSLAVLVLGLVVLFL
jgi:hypothetical protein